MAGSELYSPTVGAILPCRSVLACKISLIALRRLRTMCRAMHPASLIRGRILSASLSLRARGEIASTRYFLLIS